MKKSIKALALTMAVVPCALMLTACGGNSSLVNVDGKYELVEKTDYENVITELDNKNFSLDQSIDASRFVIDLTAKTEMQGMDITTKYSLDAKAKNFKKFGTDNESVELVCKNKTTATVKYQGQSATDSSTAYMYVKNGNLYVNDPASADSAMPGQPVPPAKYFMALPTNSASEPSTTVTDISFRDILEIVPEANWEGNLTVDKFVDEEKEDFKVKVTINGTYFAEYVNRFISSMPEMDLGLNLRMNDDVVIYIVYKGDTLVGLRADFNASVSVSSMNLDITGKMEMVGFEGELTFPDFSSYVEFDYNGSNF